ncbi:MAG: hypothetical protein OXB86_04055 [Bdellovibrionales bacterium]|nr:hypothetical protein [Bdellovibrionales bacterium]
MFISQPLFLKKWMRKFKDHRHTILRVHEASFLEMNMDVKILKKRSSGSIYLEFLLKKPDGSFRLINSIDLPGPYNGYYEFGKGTVSLGLLDQNGDGRMEVIAPTFDNFFRPHANIIFYHPKLHQFKLHPKVKPIQFQ